MSTVKKYKRQSLMQLVLILAIVVVANVIFSRAFVRFDLTQDNRYTISETTKDILGQVDDVVYFQILLAGDLPAEYKRLQQSITETLDEYRIYSNRQIEYGFFNPFELGNREEVNKAVMELKEKGVVPRAIAEQSLGEVSQKRLFPSAIVSYKGREMVINFLPEQSLGQDASTVVNSGISTLEYNISNTIRKLLQPRNKRIAFTSGHGELPRPLLAGLGVKLQQEQFDITFMDLPKTVGINPTIDLVIVAKPTQEFDEQDKFKLDQYIMQGGKVLWMLDGMQATLDSLRGSTEFLAMRMDNNLEDLLFNYGARINRDLILDKAANPIPVFSGGGQAQNLYPWPFYPVIYPPGNHPITSHLDPVMTRFVSSLDTIKTPGVEKTILLTSSNQSTAWKAPVLVRLSLATEPPLEEQFNEPNLPVAALLEGTFRSHYKGRIPQSFIETYQDSLGLQYRERSDETAMIVISDGDIARSEWSNQRGPRPLGLYPFTNVTFANRDFLMNCIEYLTDDQNLILTRTKEFKVRPLNREQVKAEQYKWQILNLVIPALVILLFAGVYNFVRKKKYEGKV